MHKVLHEVAPGPGTPSRQFHLKPQVWRQRSCLGGKKPPGKYVGREGRDPGPLVGRRTRTEGGRLAGEGETRRNSYSYSAPQVSLGWRLWPGRPVVGVSQSMGWCKVRAPSHRPSYPMLWWKDNTEPSYYPGNWPSR